MDRLLWGEVRYPERNEALSKGHMEIGNLMSETGGMVWLTVRNATGRIRTRQLYLQLLLHAGRDI